MQIRRAASCRYESLERQETTAGFRGGDADMNEPTLKENSLDDSHPLARALQYLERFAQLLLRVRRGHDRAQPRLAFRHRGIGDPRREHPFFEQLAAELHRET